MEYDWLRSNFMNWGVLDAYQSFQSKVWESHKWWISTIKAKGDNWTGYGLQHILSADLMWRIALMWWKQDLHRFVLSTVVWLEYELTVQGYPKCFDNLWHTEIGYYSCWRQLISDLSNNKLLLHLSINATSSYHSIPLCCIL